MGSADFRRISITSRTSFRVTRVMVPHTLHWIAHSAIHTDVTTTQAATTTTTPRTNTKMTTKAPKAPKFLRTLYTILHSEPTHVLAWAPCGSHFQVFDVHALETRVLPRYFKHNKFASFQRQLNNFGFRKWTKTRASVCTFSHDSLRQCHPSELGRLVEECGIVSPHVKETGKRTRSDSGSSSCSTASELTQSEASDDEPEQSKRVKTDVVDVDDCEFLSMMELMLRDSDASDDGLLSGDFEDLEALPIDTLELASDDDKWSFGLIDFAFEPVTPVKTDVHADVGALLSEDWSDLLDLMA